MRILAIESSCDETAAAVVENGRTVLSNVIASQVEEHKLYGGVVPEIASRRHAEAVSAVTQRALSDAGLTLREIDAVAVTYAPGLIGALLVGVNYAKSLAYAAKLPLIPVHHLRGHVAANYLSHPDLEPPFLCLVVSGGHTHLVEVKDYTTFSVIGKTRDDAAGEALDKAARAMGLRIAMAQRHHPVLVGEWSLGNNIEGLSNRTTEEQRKVSKNPVGDGRLFPNGRACQNGGRRDLRTGAAGRRDREAFLDVRHAKPESNLPDRLRRVDG